MMKTIERAREPDLFLFVFDPTQPFPSFPLELLDIVKPSKSINIMNKSDLDEKIPPYPALIGSVPLSVSALTGQGFDELIAAIVQRAESFQKASGIDDIAINSRHAHALVQAREYLQQAQSKLALNEPVELLASDLRGVLTAYGEISGKVDNEQMLDALFSTFCIGK